jgi:succinate dehydrogenase/fumarate reductase-like Fe-S protein
MRKFFPILIMLALALAAVSPAVSADEKTVEQLKVEAEHAEPGQQGRLYAEIADRLVAVADKQFTDGESVDGHATVQQVLQYATKAHDLAIETRKKMKETEKSLRQCRYRLENMRRTLAAEDRPSVEAVEKQLEKLTEDVLESMFAPPNSKKDKK